MTERLIRKSSVCWVFMGLAALAGCSSSRLTSTWSPPGTAPITFRKVVVVCISSDKTTRRVAEDAMVRQIQKAEAAAGYKLLPAGELRDVKKVRTRIAAAGFDGAVTMRLLAIDKEVTWVHGANPSHYRHFGRYYGRAWGGAYDPGHFQVDDVVRIETNVYSVADGKLVWSGKSETFNPRSVESLVAELAVEVAKDLRKRGLLPSHDKVDAKP